MDTRTLSRYFGAFCLVVGPATAAIGSDVYNEDDPAVQQLADVAAHPGRMTLSLVVGLVLVLMLPAVLYAARLARRGAPKLAAAGGALSFLGWAAGLISLGGIGVVYAAGAEADDRAAAADLIDAATSHWAYGTLVGVFVLGHIVGMFLLGMALWRSRVVPAWAAWIFALSPIAHAVARGVGPLADQATFVLLAVSTIMVAIALVRTPNDAWDLPPNSRVPATEPRVPAPVG